MTGPGAVSLSSLWLSAFQVAHLSPRTVWLYVKLWLTRQATYAVHGDDLTQLGGDFIVDRAGVLRLACPSHVPADRPSIESLLKVPRKIQ